MILLEYYPSPNGNTFCNSYYHETVFYIPYMPVNIFVASYGQDASHEYHIFV